MKTSSSPHIKRSGLLLFIAVFLASCSSPVDGELSPLPTSEESSLEAESVQSASKGKPVVAAFSFSMYFACTAFREQVTVPTEIRRQGFDTGNGGSHRAYTVGETISEYAGVYDVYDVKVRSHFVVNEHAGTEEQTNRRLRTEWEVSGQGFVSDFSFESHLVVTRDGMTVVDTREISGASCQPL